MNQAMINHLSTGVIVTPFWFPLTLRPTLQEGDNLRREEWSSSRPTYPAKSRRAGNCVQAAATITVSLDQETPEWKHHVWPSRTASHLGWKLSIQSPFELRTTIHHVVQERMDSICCGNNQCDTHSICPALPGVEYGLCILWILIQYFLVLQHVKNWYLLIQIYNI